MHLFVHLHGDALNVTLNSANNAIIVYRKVDGNEERRKKKNIDFIINEGAARTHRGGISYKICTKLYGGFG